MAAIRLIADHGVLFFPFGGAWGERDANGNVPSLLFVTYAAGDSDTCPWPMASNFRTPEQLRFTLARALFDERECNDRFKYGDAIELPDGTPFDFDAVLAAHV